MYVLELCLFTWIVVPYAYEHTKLGRLQYIYMTEELAKSEAKRLNREYLLSLAT